MSLSADESVGLTKDILKLLKKEKISDDLEVILAPSHTSLESVGRIIKGTKISLAGQDIFWESKGAYTGEVSAAVLKELGCKYAIIGHSERRYYLKETSEIINMKVRAALLNNLIPIICVGESFEERKEGQKDFVVSQQTILAIQKLTLVADEKIIIAYEPVWVIGSGQAVEPQEAEHACQVIRQALIDNLPEDSTDKRTSIIYGGSVNDENIAGSLKQRTINGALVGGASLKAAGFVKLIVASNK